MADLENPGVPKFEKINSNKLYEALETIAELEKKRDESEKRGSELAASYCDGVIGDEYGRPHCRYKVERDAALAEVERNKLTIAAMNEAHAKLAADLEAVQARVAELEKQEPAGWLDLLTQPGLLNRVQRSPALWEISQQGEDLLGLDVPEIEVPDSMIEKAWQRFERTLQQLETPGQAEQAEQADNDVELDMKLVERLQVDLASKGDGVHMPLMTVAQHNRIVAALSAQQSAQPEFCCKHSYKVAKQAAWGARDLTQCKCDHNEYCEHCWPDDFREGGKWHGGFETKQSAPERAASGMVDSRPSSPHQSG